MRLQHLIGNNLPGEHYPAFDHDPDSSRLSTISAEKKALLDSLLKVVGVERVFYTGTDTQPEFRYVYAPHLKENIAQSQACEDSEYYICGLLLALCGVVFLWLG